MKQHPVCACGSSYRTSLFCSCLPLAVPLEVLHGGRGEGVPPGGAAGGAPPVSDVLCRTAWPPPPLRHCRFLIYFSSRRGAGMNEEAQSVTPPPSSLSVSTRRRQTIPPEAKGRHLGLNFYGLHLRECSIGRFNWSHGIPHLRNWLRVCSELSCGMVDPAEAMLVEGRLALAVVLLISL